MVRDRRAPGANKDPGGCRRCDYGGWGLLDDSTEVRYCQNRGCNSSETRPHSCAKNGCSLHPDNR